MARDDQAGGAAADTPADESSTGADHVPPAPDESPCEGPIPDEESPAANPTDDCVAVVAVHRLRALIDVHRRGHPDVLVFFDPGHGLIARNRGVGNCYWVQTELAAAAFERFRVVETRASLDVTALRKVLDRHDDGDPNPEDAGSDMYPDGGTGGHVTLLYSDAEGFRVGIDGDRHSVGGDEPKLSEELRERDAFEQLVVTGDARPEVRFEIDAERFGAVAGVDSGHTHLRIDSDTTDKTVTFSLVGHPDGAVPLAFEFDADDLRVPPLDTGWGTEYERLGDLLRSSREEIVGEAIFKIVGVLGNTPDTATSYLCTESIVPATTPMRGPVQVLHSDGKPTTRFTYTRADGTVSVKTAVSHRLDEVEGLP